MNRDRPVLVFLIASLNGGGAQKVLSGVVERLRGAWDIRIVLTDANPEKDVYAETMERLSVPVVRIRDHRHFGLPLKILSVRRAILKNRPDVVGSWMTGPNALCGAALLGTGIPYVLSERNDTRATLGNFPWHPRLFSFLFRKSISGKNAKAVVACAKRLADILREEFPTNAEIVTIQNGIDVEALAARSAEPLPEEARRLFDGKTVVAVGRLDAQKDYPTLFRALACGGPETAKARLLILGEGALEPALREKAVELGVGDRVFFCGYRRNPHAWVSRADVYALCSTHEGFPNALAEAMSTNGHCVSTDCPTGPSEIIENGKSGLLVPVGDERALSEALERMLSDAELRNRCAENAKNWALDHSFDRTAREWDRVLRKAAGLDD